MCVNGIYCQNIKHKSVLILLTLTICGQRTFLPYLINGTSSRTHWCTDYNITIQYVVIVDVVAAATSRSRCKC